MDTIAKKEYFCTILRKKYISQLLTHKVCSQNEVDSFTSCKGDTVGCGIVLPQRHIFFTRNGEFIGKLLEIPISSEEEPENEISDNEKFIYQKGVGISRFSWKGDKHATIDTSMSSELYLREKRGRTIDKKIISELCAEKPKIDPNLYYPIISSTSPAIVEVNLGQIPFKFDISKLNCKFYNEI